MVAASVGLVTAATTSTNAVEAPQSAASAMQAVAPERTVAAPAVSDLSLEVGARVADRASRSARTAPVAAATATTKVVAAAALDAPAQPAAAPKKAAAPKAVTGLGFAAVEPEPVEAAPEPQPEPTRTQTTTTATTERTRTPETTQTPPPPPPTAEPAPASGIVAIAQQYLGVPYVYGGSSPSEGFDCSGFTSYVFRQVGIYLPRSSGAQAASLTRVSNPRPGDLVVFGSPVTHIGIYIGNGMMIDAPKPGLSVEYNSLKYRTNYWFGRP